MTLLDDIKKSVSRNFAKHSLSQSGPSELRYLLGIADAAQAYIREVDNTAPDAVMRKIRRDELRASIEGKW